MKSTVILMVALMAAASVQAHGTSNIRGEAVKPFTGEISDEVAVERLRSLGFQDVRVQSRQDKSILLEATQAGAPVQLRVNRHNLRAQRAYQRAGFLHSHDLCQDIGNGFVMDDHVLILRLT